MTDIVENPHYTPAWLAEAVADEVPLDASVVFDPACGSGSLLHAVAKQRAHAERMFVGVERSARAVRQCREKLGRVVGPSQVRLHQQDYLRRRVPHDVGSNSVVVMNPPFKGYGRMSPCERESLGARSRLPGRFNLAHVFVVDAIRRARAGRVVAIVPAAWAHARKSSFREALDEEGGSWHWREVPGDVFPGVNTRVGILVWQRMVQQCSPQGGKVRGIEHDWSLGSLDGIQIRVGAATGCDRVFCSLASQGLPAGLILDAVRGRDVSRPARSQIWVPPRAISPLAATLLEKAIPAPAKALLLQRSCTTARGRRLFEYHDAWPPWFVGHPKVLVPEIVHGDARVEIDVTGSRFPLHSAIAVKVPDAATAVRVAQAIEHFLAVGGPSIGAPLSRGARRLTAAALADVRVTSPGASES